MFTARRRASCSVGPTAGSPKCSNLNALGVRTEDSVCRAISTWLGSCCWHSPPSRSGCGRKLGGVVLPPPPALRPPSGCCELGKQGRTCLPGLRVGFQRHFCPAALPRGQQGQVCMGHLLSAEHCAGHQHRLPNSRLLCPVYAQPALSIRAKTERCQRPYKWVQTVSGH